MQNGAYPSICAKKPITNTNIPPTVSGLEFEEGEEWNGELPQNGKETENTSETITFPGYSDMYFSEKNSNIAFINPKENTVHMVYTLYEGDNQIYETKAIEPGKMISVNVLNYFSTGTHDIILKTSTYDVNTYVPCNATEQTVKFTIE